jgi:iron(II)-dependent oxidoreductase
MLNDNPERAFPWGDEVEWDRANTEAAGVGRVSAVGCFKGGASPYGCEDMSGNILEWTRSLWGEDWNQPDFPYPYVSEDGREELDPLGEPLRVIRGTAFLYPATAARCSLRIGIFSDTYYEEVGFRVSLSPSSSDL